MRTMAEERRSIELLQEFDRTVIELAELGVDVALARPGTPANLAVVMIRLEQLERAIRARDWQEVAREWERVRASLDKAMAGGAPRGQNGRPVR
jgi:hypothetical protein